MPTRLFLMAGAASAALLSAPFAAQAQDAEPVAEGGEVGAIIVSGGRTPVDAQSYARAATIITAEELEQRQPRTVIDALRQIPGLHVSRTGAPGGLSNLRIRGSESNHTLVLIDGIETANSSDAYDFSQLDVSNIERIEVLRGPQSALYGAGATAGVINIITKRGVRDGMRAEIVARGGSAPSTGGSALLQAGAATADVSIGLFWTDDEGWDASGDGGEKDGSEKRGGSLKAVWDLASDVQLRGVARYTRFDNEFDSTNFGCGDAECYVGDGIGRSTGETVEVSGAIEVSSFGGALTHTPKVEYSARRDGRETSFGPSDSDVSTLKAGYQATALFGADQQHGVTGAFEYKRETFENSFAGGDQKDRDQYGAVLDYQGDLTEAWFVQLGARYDANEDFDNAFAWSASTSYTLLGSGTRFHASIGQAQTNPTFFELFGSIPGEFVGNEDLKPERNLGFDLGVEQRFFGDRAVVDVTYFQERLEDEIVGFGPSIFGPATVDNLSGDSERQGVEVSATLRPIEGLTVGASYTYLDATDPNGVQEVRRPKHAAGANIAYRFLDDRAVIGSDLTYYGDTRQSNFGDASFTSPVVDVDGYFTVDLNGGFRVSDGVEVFGTVKNLFDVENEEVLGYAGQPLTGEAGVKISF